MVAVYIISGIVWGVIWGVATNNVIHNKGYDNNWFLWGFFFGFIAFIVALTKPENKKTTAYTKHADYDYSPSQNYRGSEEHGGNRLLTNWENYENRKPSSTSTSIDGYWKCVCKNFNSSDVDVCSACGRNRDGSFPEKPEEKKKEQSDNDLENLKKYKELLDMNAITQEEYDMKKKEILGL